MSGTAWLSEAAIIFPVAALENPSTRRRAMAEIATSSWACAPRKDGAGRLRFSVRLPGGFAAALGVTDTPAWLGIWREIAGRIVDRDDNGNNRFEVAGDLNRRVSGVCHPFWGCPAVLRIRHDVLHQGRLGTLGGETSHGCREHAADLETVRERSVGSRRCSAYRT